MNATVKSQNQNQAAAQGTSGGCLYLVATPIGNLEDITLRALRVLKEADIIACEDTRQTLKLLSHYGIRKRLESYHEHNEMTRAPELVIELEQGAKIALVSDAGTPLVSDPGYHLISLCARHGVAVVPIPGPCALVAALAASGMPTREFVFLGFPPPRAVERRNTFRALAGEKRTLVFYEAPHRLLATVEDALETLGNRPAVVAREVSKIHEEFLRGHLDDLLVQLRRKEPRGEITLIIGAPDERTNHQRAQDPQRVSFAQRVMEIARSKRLDHKSALKQAAREFGITRREAYKQWLKTQREAAPS